MIIPPAASTSTGAFSVSVISMSTGKSIKTVTGSISANTSIVAAVPGKRIKVCVVSLRTAYSAASITPILTDGNGGTTIWSDLMQAITGTIWGSVAAVSAPAFVCGTAAGNALYLNPNGQTVLYSVSYYDDDGT